LQEAGSAYSATGATRTTSERATTMRGEATRRDERQADVRNGHSHNTEPTSVSIHDRSTSTPPFAACRLSDRSSLTIDRCPPRGDPTGGSVRYEPPRTDTARSAPRVRR